MRANPIKEALKAGKTVVGAGLSVAANPIAVRIMANAGYDFLFIDTEHNHPNPTMLIEIVQMARACGISPLIRPTDTEYHLIANALDTGADGLVVPRVESRAQAERLVSYAKFPPMGVRGCGTIATLDYKPQDWRQALPWLNEQSLICVQVESQKAIDNLDEILQVPGVDVAVVGPLDLSISLGCAGQFDDPREVAAIERVIAICQKHKVVPGIVMGTAEAAKPWWEKGMRWLVCGGDAGFLAAGAAHNVKFMRTLTGQA